MDVGFLESLQQTPSSQDGVCFSILTESPINGTLFVVYYSKKGGKTMPKGTNQKRKLMVLARFLQKHSDEEHPLTLGQLQEELERWNAPAERKSIYDDMEQLRQLGQDVQTRRGVGDR